MVKAIHLLITLFVRNVITLFVRNVITTVSVIYVSFRGRVEVEVDILGVFEYKFDVKVSRLAFYEFDFSLLRNTYIAISLNTRDYYNNGSVEILGEVHHHRVGVGVCMFIEGLALRCYAEVAVLAYQCYIESLEILLAIDGDEAGAASIGCSS